MANRQPDEQNRVGATNVFDVETVGEFAQSPHPQPFSQREKGEEQSAWGYSVIWGINGLAAEFLNRSL